MRLWRQHLERVGRVQGLEDFSAGSVGNKTAELVHLRRVLACICENDFCAARVALEEISHIVHLALGCQLYAKGTNHLDDDPAIVHRSVLLDLVVADELLPGRLAGPRRFRHALVFEL